MADEDDDVNDGWGLSMYNEGKGVAFTVQLTALPKATDKKRRKNAASKPVSKIVFIHEDMSIHDMLTNVIIQLKRNDMFQDLHVLEGEIRRAPFDLLYTIARTPSKNIQLQNQADYAQMMEDAGKKPSPAVTLAMTEKKLAAIDNEGSEGGTDDDSDDNATVKKKQKGPTKEELNQANVITQLQRLYRCEDRSCPYDFCWPGGENAKHLHLTYLHLRTWSAAIDLKEDGVGLEIPPHTKIFDTTFTGNTVDIATLATRRATALQPVSQNIPTVSFEGLADVIKQLQPAVIQQQPPPITVRTPPRPRLPPKMSLAEFCVQYDISHEISEKLCKQNIIGPHLLRLIGDEALRVEGELNLGELATLRDAQERWVASLDA